MISARQIISGTLSTEKKEDEEEGVIAKTSAVYERYS